MLPPPVPDLTRIQSLVRAVRVSPSAGSEPAQPSIFSLASASYGARPGEDMTIPTGFDPVAVVLFEAIVEAAFLVASAEGDFDAAERGAFEHLVREACAGAVSAQQVAALVGELQGQLRSEGVDRRVRVVASAVPKREHADEVLRVAALTAERSGSATRGGRSVLGKIAVACRMTEADVDVALDQARSALGS